MRETTVKILDYKPGYTAVLKHLRKKITSGKYKAGDTLPARLGLTKTYNVALCTIRQSLLILAGSIWFRRNK